MPKQSTTPQANRDAALSIVRTLRGSGHVAYFAGGCVRDELLGLAPSDYDVATDAVPERVCSLFPRTAEVGASFGVVLVKIGREVVEVATFRSDGAYSDSRRPDLVHFSDPESDARRRDFTVNALFLDPLAPGGIARQVIDHVGGLDDLSERVLRAVGNPDNRLAEDHLRALRAARLSARLGFTIEPLTAAAIRRHAAELKGVSRERIGDEVRRMLLHPARGAAVRAIADLGLEAPVLGPFAGLGGHCSDLLASIPVESDLATCLAAWAIDLGHDPVRDPVDELVRRWRRALCLSNEERDALHATLSTLRVLLTDWPRLGVAGQKRLASRGAFRAAEALLTALDAAAAGEVASRVRDLEGSAGGIAPEPVLSGDDLVAAGLTPGPAFKVILDRVYDAQLEGKLRTKPEALELALRLGVQAG